MIYLKNLHMYVKKVGEEEPNTNIKTVLNFIVIIIPHCHKYDFY